MEPNWGFRGNLGPEPPFSKPPHTWGGALLLRPILGEVMALVVIPMFKNLHSAVFFSLQSLCLRHTGKPMGVAVSHCITWFQTQLILTACQIRYHSQWWDHRSTGQL